MTITTTPGLASMLRDGSRAEHTEAENSSFMSELLAGRIAAAGYAQYLGRLRRVYEALESVGSRLAEHPIAGSVVDHRLDRLASIDEDLAFWGGGRRVLVTSPATDAYVDRIERTLADPVLYVAHHYTRYLGDLSGGQAIGRILTREFGLAPGEGVAFYRFDAIPKPKPYKDAYRERLDALPLDASERQRIVSEVRDVFSLNGDVFGELTRLLLPAA